MGSLPPTISYALAFTRVTCLFPLGVLLAGDLALYPVSLALLHLVPRLSGGPIQHETKLLHFITGLYT
jgi:hypothetical protein